MQGYFPNLQALLDLGELNYRRILSLFPGWQSMDVHTVAWMGEGSQSRRIGVEAIFKVVQREKYTTSMEISFKNWVDLAGKQKDQMILVRLYHDVKTAEVVLPAKKNIMSGRYDTPNADMFQADEKMQSNHFLGEWLAYCERHTELEPEHLGVAGDL